MNHKPQVDLRSTLITTSAIGWSGQLMIRVKEQGQGMVVMRSGRIAWAVSDAQSETLGDYLWRLGHVSKSDLKMAKTRFREFGGKRKIGNLLEEFNLLPRPVLRRCLLLHTRTAVHAMLVLPGIELQATEGEMAVDEEFTFSIEEILTDYIDMAAREFLPARPFDPGRFTCWHAGNEGLSILANLPGYSWSALISASGEVLAAHSFESGLNPQELSVQVAALIEMADRLARAGRLVSAGTLLLRGAAGGLMCQWLGVDKRHMVVVSVGKDGHLGSLDQRMDFCLDSLRPFADRIMIERGESDEPRS